jgi:F-type H+-transporting ATPase subunit a
MTFIASPMEQFEVVPLLQLSIFSGSVFSLTNFAFFAIITVIVALIVPTLGAAQGLIVPSRWTLAAEATLVSFVALVREQVGKTSYVPFFYALFFFILISNLIGNIPYTYTIATSAILSMGLSFTILIGVTLLAARIHGIHALSFFVPAGTPIGLVPLLILIEIISYIARAFSLGVRLFSNMVAGHTLLKILSSFLYPAFTGWYSILALIPMALFTALMGLELAVSFIQAFVFTVLTCSYVRDAIELH